MPTPVINPIEVDDTVEALLGGNRTSSNMLYAAVVAVTACALTATALTSVDLTIRASAVLAPAIDRQTLRSLSDGYIARMMTGVGSHVQAGDTLIALATDGVERAYSAARHAVATQRRRRADLTVLLNAVDDVSLQHQAIGLSLAQTRAIARATLMEWAQGSGQIVRAERAQDRLSQLAQRGFGAPADLEAAEFEVAHAREERAFALERRRSDWAEQIALADQQIVDLERDLATRRSDQAARYITAPVTGTVTEVMAVSVGSVVRSGDPIATISPEGQIIADALVAPRDVAYLRVGMPARLLVDGYDVQEWGGVDATVTSVAQDYTLADGHPVFRVRVQPRRAELRRANGTRALLGKGLHCQVRFLIGRKRLGELLRQRTSELLDPVMSTAR